MKSVKRTWWQLRCISMQPQKAIYEASVTPVVYFVQNNPTLDRSMVGLCSILGPLYVLFKNSSLNNITNQNITSVFIYIMHSDMGSIAHLHSIRSFLFMDEATVDFSLCEFLDQKTLCAAVFPVCMKKRWRISAPNFTRETWRMNRFMIEVAWGSCHVGYSAGTVCEHLLVYCFQGRRHAGSWDFLFGLNTLSLHILEPLQWAGLGLC